MNKKTLRFNSIKLNKKEFHKSKKPIDLFSVNWILNFFVSLFMNTNI